MQRDHKYWTYIVASLTGTLYIGMTNGIERRIAEHKAGTLEGFASEYACNRLVYWESFHDVRRAIDREKQLKGWRREKKIALIESLNPSWKDLAKDWGQPIQVRALVEPMQPTIETPRETLERRRATLKEELSSTKKMSS